MSAREKLMSTLSALAFGAGVAGASSTGMAQGISIDCTDIDGITSVETLFAMRSTTCGSAAMTRAIQLINSDPANQIGGGSSYPNQ